jgi:hypothetical protein
VVALRFIEPTAASGLKPLRHLTLLKASPDQDLRTSSDRVRIF